MSQAPEGFVRVRMIRHEYSSEAWASVYRGRLLSGEVYDVPEFDQNGKPVAAKWLAMGIVVKSNAPETHYDELRAAAYDMAGAGSYNAAMLGPTAAASQPRVQADGPVQKGMSEEELAAGPDQFPEGGLRELSPEQAAAMDKGEGMQRPYSGEADARNTFMTNPAFTGGGVDPTAAGVSHRMGQVNTAPTGLERMSPAFTPKQGGPVAEGGAFTAEELSQPAEDDEPDKPVFNRNQLKALTDAGYGSQAKLDKASDEELLKVDGVGEGTLKRYREEQKAREASAKQAGPVKD